MTTSGDEDSNAPCWVTNEILIAYIDQDVPYSQQATLERHIAACPVCLRRFARSREIGDLLRRALPTIEPAERVRRRTALLDLFERLNSEGAPQCEDSPLPVPGCRSPD